MKLFVILFIGVINLMFGQNNPNVLVKNNVFKVSYNETLEQPNWVEYSVRKITKVADRKGMDFHIVKGVYTSNSSDYKNNVWDKGHMAPAAAFTDSYDNLKTTFSYLNCSLQFDRLNRGAWRLLEQQERVWVNEFGTLKVKVVLEFKVNHLVLPTGGHVPSGYFKYIKFPNGGMKCYYFPNSNPTKNWREYKIKCK